MHSNDYITNTNSSLAEAVPIEDRLRIPENEPVPLLIQDVDPPAPNPDHQQGHIPMLFEDVDPLLYEIYQKPYDSGLKLKHKPTDRISYFPGGFTVATVLAGDLSEVVNADDDIPTLPGQSWPDKMAFHFEFSDPAYSTPVHTKQRRYPKTRGAFATLAAEEIKKMLIELPQFPYALDQIKVVNIDVRSRGTVQARLFISAEVLAQAQAAA
ncbi:hypothetical protein V8D89_012960 [Ganoderma adspersum]